MQRPSEPSAPDAVREETEPVPFELRGAKALDLPFVADSWRRSYEDAPSAKAPSLAEYIRTQRRVIETCLASSDTTIAHWPGDPDHILGWVSHRPGVVHYVFVKQVYRRRGLGRALLEHAAGRDGTVWTTHARRLGYWQRRIVFCPGLIFG